MLIIITIIILYNYYYKITNLIQNGVICVVLKNKNTLFFCLAKKGIEIYNKSSEKENNDVGKFKSVVLSHYNIFITTVTYNVRVNCPITIFTEIS